MLPWNARPNRRALRGLFHRARRGVTFVGDFVRATSALTDGHEPGFSESGIDLADSARSTR